jgi:hypothetical protein
MIIEEFKPYQPKPVTRYAYQIAEDDTIADIQEVENYLGD